MKDIVNVPRCENWEPNEVDKLAVADAYFSYATGVVLLHDPESVTSLVIPNKDTTTESGKLVIVAHAESLMWESLSRIVKHANHPDNRANFGSEMLHNEAYPRMHRIINGIYEDISMGERLRNMHPMLPILRPLPLAKENIYKYVARKRTDKVKTSDLMGAFAVSDKLEHIVNGRRINAQSRAARFQTRGAAADRLPQKRPIPH